ncbi:MAG: HNH endonuclease [Myxococcales bacterium]
MSEACAQWPRPGIDVLDAIAAEAWALAPPAPHERKWVLRSEAGLLLDKLLSRCARGRGALDVAIGEGLAAMAVGDRVVRLGFSGIGDYAIEELGIARRTAQKLAQLARGLREHPELRALVWTGEITPRKAEILLRSARADEEWLSRARNRTVRGLEADVSNATGEPPAAVDEERWERICVPVSAEGQATVDEAIALARKALGATAPKSACLEVICQEYLGAHAAPDDDDGADAVLHASVPPPWLEPLKAWLEQETAQWSFLDRVEPVAVPVPSEPVEEDAWLLDEELRRLVRLRRRWDEVFGHLAMLFRMLGLWRDARFASFAHYCEERLGMSERAVEQRIWLERRFYALPPLRNALREGRISYEQARLVAAHATDRTVEAELAIAGSMTCIQLQRHYEAREERQMCTRGELDLRVPVRVRVLVAAAFAAARKAARRWLTPGECLQTIAQHFVDTWGAALRERRTVSKEALARDRGFCLYPKCSRSAAHAHHVDYRAHGGPDELPNLAGLCAVHHLRGLHGGWIRVTGTAPDRLRWEIVTAPPGRTRFLGPEP